MSPKHYGKVDVERSC